MCTVVDCTPKALEFRVQIECVALRVIFFSRFVNVHRLALVASSSIAFSINNGLRNFMTAIMFFALIQPSVSQYLSIRIVCVYVWVNRGRNEREKKTDKKIEYAQTRRILLRSSRFDMSYENVHLFSSHLDECIAINPLN